MASHVGPVGRLDFIVDWRRKLIFVPLLHSTAYEQLQAAHVQHLARHLTQTATALDLWHMATPGRCSHVCCRLFLPSSLHPPPSLYIRLLGCRKISKGFFSFFFVSSPRCNFSISPTKLHNSEAK